MFSLIWLRYIPLTTLWSPWQPHIFRAGCCDRLLVKQQNSISQMLSRTLYRSLSTSSPINYAERQSRSAPRLTGYLSEMLRSGAGEPSANANESVQEQKPRSSAPKFRSQRNATANKGMIRNRRTSARRAKDGDDPRHIANNIYSTTIPKAPVPQSFEVNRDIYKIDAMSLQDQVVDQVSDSQVESEVIDGDYSRYVLDGSSDNSAIQVASSALSRNASIDVGGKNSVLSTIQKGVSG